MATQHAQQRQSTDDDDELRSHRQLNSLWRLASAIAKFDLSETVTLEHIKRAELIIGETLTEKDPGLFTTGVTKADRELERDIKEGIITFFVQDDSDTGKTASDLLIEVSKSISSYRKPSLNEFTEILDSLSEGETNGFTKAGDMYFKLE
jgi:DNA replicative helicase MCM subunit Mcm2 (Cdc46/Mcm family)